MSTLEQLQLDFMSMLQHGSAMEYGLSNITNEQSNNIYKRNYREVHVNALADTYETVLALVGQDYFRQLALRYLTDHPSSSGDLNEYGEFFVDFLEKILPQAPGGESLHYLPDVARLDWLRWQVLVAPQSQAICFNELLDWPSDQQGEARLKLAPSCQLMHSEYPLHGLWRLAQGAKDKVDLDSGGEAVLVGRAQQQIVIQPLSAALADLLLHWQQLTLAESLTLLSRQYPDNPINELFANMNELVLTGELRRNTK